MKQLFSALLLLSCVSVSADTLKVESTIRVNDKSITRSHLVSNGEHVVYPTSAGIIFDAVVSEFEEKDGTSSRYHVQLKVVKRDGSTITEKSGKAKWGETIAFECPVENVTAALELKVTQEISTTAKA